jgi:hypothetical protein
MKNRNTLTKLTVLSAVLLTFGAVQARADILPLVKISFAPIGITMDQSARLNLVNNDVPNGMIVIWRLIDANGLVLAQSTVTLSMGKIFSVDYRRPGEPPPPNPNLPDQLRAEVRAQVDIVTPNVSEASLRRSLEVFNNDTGATTVCMGGANP